jgi:hypothetical protein
MKQNDQNTSRDMREEGLIVLGVASVETKGPGGSVESNGKQMGSAISEE